MMLFKRASMHLNRVEVRQKSIVHVRAYLLLTTILMTFCTVFRGHFSILKMIKNFGLNHTWLQKVKYLPNGSSDLYET